MSAAPEGGDPNADIDRETGADLLGWPAVAQAVRELILTCLGERIMREHVGADVPLALGRPLTPQLVLRVYTAIAMVLDAWEPRVRVTQFHPARAGRDGILRIGFAGAYRPRALLGDLTEEGEVTFEVSPNGQRD